MKFEYSTTVETTHQIWQEASCDSGEVAESDLGACRNSILHNVSSI